MRETHSTHGGDEDATEFWLEKLKVNDNLEDLGTDSRKH